MAERNQWMDVLQTAGAIQDGHFLLSSGRHSSRYVQCALALEHPKTAAQLGEAIAASIDVPVDRVMAPPLGGLLIGYEVARHLDVPFSFPERGSDGTFVLRRGFHLQHGERICVIEDVITTGKTTVELLDVLRSLGALPVAVGCIVDRSDTHQLAGLPIHSLLQLAIPTFTAEACPLCADSTPLRQPGSRNMTVETSL
ncbi:orotate phosphoribosyltransferase [Candidatus Bipolaricaulota bacterium]|nr:orotate phosphoribosyltransferase [Candidatus Bipolaricaulota bacterium]